MKKKLFFWKLAVIAILMNLFNLSYASDACKYMIKDLETLGGERSRGFAINNIGHVVGESHSSSGPYPGQSHAFLWTSEEGMMDLGSLGIWSWAYGVNIRDEVVGRSRTELGYTRAFIWDETNGIKELSLLPGKESSAAFCINDLKQIAGDQDLLACLWDTDGSMIDIGHLGGNWSRSYAINNLGTVVGSSRLESGESHAFIWSKENGIEDLGVGPNEGWSSASGINNIGQIAVTISNSELYAVSAYLWTKEGGLINLGNLGGEILGYPWNRTYAFDINDRGQIVGTSVTEDGVAHPFLWDSKNGMQDLTALIPPQSVWLLEWPYSLVTTLSINNLGQITGEGNIDLDGEFEATHAFLLTPVIGIDTCDGDLDCDKDVDGKDLEVFIRNFGSVNCP